MVVTLRGMARPDGSPKDVDREFVTAFFVVNENSSWYLDHNISAYAGDPKTVNKLERRSADADANYMILGSGFAAANFKFTINGYLFGNVPVMTMRKGERVRWYVASMGVAFHTPHWHGNVVNVNGTQADVVAIGPAQTLVADMVPDDPGTWMYHCHMSDHMEAGMFALYRVTP
jgi:hephaestin